MTRIVHTADWHLGARLIDGDRHDEHRAFLDWLLAQLTTLKPDLLIVAGDIFDSATPPQEALQLYYRFLAHLAAAVRCRTLILGGNHDSPATLHAPRELLAALDIRVLATPPPPDRIADALLELPDAVVCAVPFLRERDLRTAAPGQSPDEIAAALRAGIARHYRTLHAAALARAGSRPLLATGHLTALGSQSSASERAIHIGNLGAAPASCFDGFAYTALGHIHRPQSVGADDRVRYAGSPLPLSFAEAETPKEIRVIDLAGGQLTHRPVAIPVFRRLLRLDTTAATLAAALAAAQAAPGEPLDPWLELTVADAHLHPDLDRQVREAAAGLRLRVLKLLAPPPPAADPAASSAPPPRALSDLTPAEVFAERLRRAALDPASPEGAALTATFAELLSAMQETDPADTITLSADTASAVPAPPPEARA